jgi:TolB-like protein/Flp pilus assembly protein TadD
LAVSDETTLHLPRVPGEERRRTSAGDIGARGWSGSSVAHYRIFEQIGSGGMGLVFRAEDIRLLRTVALKFLPPSLTLDPLAKERFLKEAQAASALDHPNIATVHELGESDDGQLFLAMACYDDGETLQARLDRGPLPVDEAVLFAAQIAAGLSRAHQRGIVHRDIKPSNLIVTADGIVKILDFGIAKLAGQEVLARDGMILGTLAYMSPEQASGREVDPRTDVWSLGVVLYAMLAGQPPFLGEDDRQLVEAIFYRQPEPLRSVRPEVPAELERLVERMLAKSPAERPESMAEVRSALGVSSVSLELAIERPAPGRARRVLQAWPWAAGIAAAVLGAGLGAFALRPSPEPGARPLVRTATGPLRPSVAVLPFENLSRDPGQDYMAEGLTEALTTDLAKIGGLKVVSRTSAEHYKATAKPLPEIASELGVDNVLEGSVLRVGGRVRISAKLVEARADRSVWAESYERDFKDILALQSEVSRAIARQTQVQLTPQDQVRLARNRTVQPEVYEAYLRGRFEWNRRSRQGIEKAIAYFAQAVAKDPTYAPAYAGLADSYSLLPNLRVSPEAIPKARAAAQKALALDESLPEAHASLGYIRFVYDWDFAGAERELRRALELNPNYATAHHWYWVDLTVLGRTAEAEREIDLARELDPLSLPILGAYAEQLRILGRRSDWQAVVQKILDRSPDYDPVRQEIVQVAVTEGRYDDACREYEKVLANEKLKELARAMEKTRRQKGAQAAFEEVARRLAARGPHLPVSPVDVAWLYAAAGKRDAAFEWLEKAFQQRTPPLLWLGLSWDNLRGDPRYSDLLRRIGLPALPTAPFSLPVPPKETAGRTRGSREGRELEAVAHPRVDRPAGKGGDVEGGGPGHLGLGQSGERDPVDPRIADRELRRLVDYHLVMSGIVFL